MAIGLGGWYAFGGAGRDSAGADNGPIAVVARGPLVVSVTETGEVEAERRKVIANELQWPVIIKSVVAEGSMVKEGDTIVVFECKELMEAITKQRITVTSATATHTQSRESVVLKRKEMDNAVRKAEQAVVDANEALRRYVEASGPIKLADANSDIHTVKRDLALAQDQLNFKLKVNADKELNSPFSENEIEAEKLRVEKLKLSVNRAVTTRAVMEKYDHPAELRKLSMGVEDARLALERAKLEAKGEMLKAESTDEAAKATYEMQSAQLQDYEEEAKKLIVKADKEGLVVYDTGRDRRSSEVVTVEIGAKISPRQQLMIIPDMSSLQIKTKVYEAIIDQVRGELKAHVRLDSRPDAIFAGRVVRVGVLPDSQHRWLNPGVKVFGVIVRLDKDIEGLKPGMTAQVEIELARLDNVLSMPVAAVFAEQDNTYCYRMENGQPRRTAVRVGRMNDMRVEILSGLNEADQVMLAPPPMASGGATAPGKDKAGRPPEAPPPGAEVAEPATRPSGRQPGPEPEAGPPGAGRQGAGRPAGQPSSRRREGPPADRSEGPGGQRRPRDAGREAPGGSPRRAAPRDGNATP